ncbi:MAG: hypothetical protein Q7S13_03735 [Candidatus Omnitrophota bacterium]|nr:hypothetical protein [Candidatus Omnitrophota bacterium]
MILSVSLTLMIQSMTAGLRAIHYTSDYTIAQILLDNKLQELIQKGSTDAGQNKTESFEAPFDRYEYSLMTTSSDLSEALVNVRADISWMSGKRKNNISAQTYLFVPTL